MNRIILIAAMLAAPPLYAQDSTPAADTPPAAEEPGMMGHTSAMLRADAVEDAIVYSLGETYDEAIWDSGEPFAQITGGWDEVGEVEDLIIDAEAKVVGVTVDVGGFLGIGESTVLLPVGDLRLVRLPDDDAFIVVTRMTREQIENAEEVDDDLLGDD